MIAPHGTVLAAPVIILQSEFSRPVTLVQGHDALGVVLPHEHLFIDLRNQFTEPEDPHKREISQEPPCMPNFGYVRNNPYAVRGNLVIEDVDTAVDGTYVHMGR